MKSSTILVSCATVAALLSFAGNSLLCRLALRGETIDAASFTGLRLLSGSVVLVIVAITRARMRQVPAWGGSWRAAWALVGYAAAFAWAYRYIPAGTGALLLFGSVQVTMVTWGLVRGERPRWVDWGGLAVALAGLFVLVAPGLAAPPLGSAALMGLAGASWGVYSLLGRRAVDPVAATCGNFVRASLLFGLVAVASWRDWQVSATGAGLAILSGAVTSGLGYVIWYAAVRSLTATRAALVQLCVPLLTGWGGVVLLSETISPQLVASAGLILGGVAMAVFAPHPPAVTGPK